MVDILGFGYAAVVAAGGIMGYVKAGSTMSLGMGLLFGSLSAAGAYQVTQDPGKFHMLMGTSAILAGVMGMRAVKSGNFMSPAGLVAALSILTVMRFVPSLMSGPSKND